MSKNTMLHTITGTELIDAEHMDDVILECPICREKSKYEDETYFVGTHEVYCPACNNRFQFRLELPIIISNIQANEDDLNQHYQQSMLAHTLSEQNNSLI